MTVTDRPYRNAFLSLLAISAPLIIASSSAVFAQTTETPTQPTPSAPVEITTPASLPVAIVAPTPAPEPAIIERADVQPDPRPDPRHVECVAKIIMHEAAHEPRAGRVAVAQVVRTRINSGRFAADACAVARQRGQFFDVDAFNPSRDAAWTDAVAIATDTLNGAGEEVAPGALFFHAAYSPMPGRQRVTQIGGHIFYR